jgi:hypothetical protein
MNRLIYTKVHRYGPNTMFGFGLMSCNYIYKLSTLSAFYYGKQYKVYVYSSDENNSFKDELYVNSETEAKEVIKSLQNTWKTYRHNLLHSDTAQKQLPDTIY